MNDADVITDLKQFISAEITQKTSHLATKDDVQRLEDKVDGLEVKFDGLEAKVDILEEKVDGIQEFLEDSIIPYVDTVDEQVQKHEKQIRALQQKSA